MPTFCLLTFHAFDTCVPFTLRPNLLRGAGAGEGNNSPFYIVVLGFFLRGEWRHVVVLCALAAGEQELGSCEAQFSSSHVLNDEGEGWIYMCVLK
jgi:hypothetical protein